MQSTWCRRTCSHCLYHDFWRRLWHAKQCRSLRLLDFLSFRNAMFSMKISRYVVLAWWVLRITRNDMRRVL